MAWHSPLIRFKDFTKTWSLYKRSNPQIAVVFWTMDDVFECNDDLNMNEGEMLLKQWKDKYMDAVIETGAKSMRQVVDEYMQAKANKKKAGSK